MTLDQTAILDELKLYSELPANRARTLEPAFYTSKEFYELELEHIWSKQWLVVGHACEVPNPGDFLARDVLDQPMLIVRGEDNQIRALSSVCQHRFMAFFKHGECGNETRLQCPYHRWTYGLDGKLKQALHMEENLAFDMDKIRLPEFRVEIWHGLIWVNFDDDAEPLAPKLVDLDESFSAYDVSDDWVNATPYDKVWHANWKSCVENALESYHHMGLHQMTINAPFPTSLVRVERRGEFWTHHIAPLDTRIEASREMMESWQPGTLGQQEYGLDIYTIYPANCFVISPGGVSYYPQWPTSLNSMRFQAGNLTPPETTRTKREVQLSQFEELNTGEPNPNLVLDEDYVALPSVQRGITSRKLKAGPLSPLEENVFRFSQWIARTITQGMP